MSIQQFKAGYIVDCMAKVITEYKQNLNTDFPEEQSKLDQINGLLQHISSFEVEFSDEHKHKLNYTALHPVLATLNNIITRGLPTRAPVLLEELFTDIGLTKKNEGKSELNFFESEKAIDYQTIFELFHIIEPNLNITRENYGGKLGSEGEWSFLDTELKRYPYVKQILQSQRDFATINRNLDGGRSVDFSFEFPYLNSQHSELRKKGVIYEYDGSHHQINSYKYYDKYRDDAADAEGFETLRQPSDKIEKDPSIIKQFENNIFKIFETNFERNIENYLKEYTLLFIPLAVARIQKTMLEHFFKHPELFKEKEIDVAIIERDLPCGAIAIVSLQDLFENINALLEKQDRLPLPKISLTIFENPKWVLDERLHLQVNKQNETFFKNNNFDIIIDHSILRRSQIYKEKDFQNDNAIKIRSSHYCDTSFGNSRRVYCANLLHYKSLVAKRDDGSYIPVEKYEKHVNFFIQNIFRKAAFREGQLPIISRALQQKPVIGLLPTGGGKSLAFQLPAFLQPGLCLIVDPIKSLMEDQVRVLRQSWIDCCSYINSNLNREDKVKRLVDFRYGETMFLFVSPERFVMDDFRNIIQNINSSIFSLAFSYCVIDEVHCVSEWGHDFRPTYLMLGKNAQQFTKTRSENPVTLIGLTATASFDVLADIERELKIRHDDVANAIIMIENTIRPELFFRVIDASQSNDEELDDGRIISGRMKTLNEDFSKAGYNLNRLNSRKLLEKSIKDHKDNFDDTVNIPCKDLMLANENLESKSQNDFSSIVFCPVRGRHGNFSGVDYVRDYLDSASKGYFYSVDEEDDETATNEVQQHFHDFLKGKIRHIVCTKAFGMGIDKQDIRSVYHYVYSSSLESLVQEAGRAGRDKKVAEANILVSTNYIYFFDVYKLFRENTNNPWLQNRFTRKSIRQSFEKKWNDNTGHFENITFQSLQEVLDTIDSTDFNLISKAGEKYNILSPEAIIGIRSIMKNNNERHEYIQQKHKDRDIHNFFYGLAFKGVDSEKSQFLNLFKVREFQLVNKQRIYIPEQDTLSNTFENCTEDTFQFTITKTKEYPDPTDTICKILRIDPYEQPFYSSRINREHVQNSLKYSYDFTDFLFTLEENNVIKYTDLSDKQKEKLIFVYSRDREIGDTGKLIYRMHSMGFLVDYLIDYKKNNLFYCTFKKYDSIDKYVKEIEQYLRRYLSENTAIQEVDKLRYRLTKDSLIDNVLECLYYLSEFSYREIAEKRKRATDEIESVMNTSLTNPEYVADWYKQNHYVKEQIYFYFNAKYARIGFKINGKSYSLLDDYQRNMSKNEISKEKILQKYLDVFPLDGTAQNNYKHMIGSCKKIMRSLSETDLKQEWLLHLLRTFAMYAVNNPSYISEANDELELGFDNLYSDEQYHLNFDKIEPIFKTYFDKLQSNITEENSSFNDIKLIRIKLLLKLQSIGIENIIHNNKLKENNYDIR
jgi:ATP-dependent DNA helicase RecQ